MNNFYETDAFKIFAYIGIPGLLIAYILYFIFVQWLCSKAMRIRTGDNM